MPLNRSRKGRRRLDDDPFGTDGFGDSWNKPAERTFASANDSDEEFLLPVETNIIGTDWGPSAQRVGARRKAEEAKRKKEYQEWLSQRMKKKREAEAKAKVEAEARAEAAAAAAKMASEEEWRCKVQQATNCISLANPTEALNILYSLTLLGKETLKYIDAKEKENVGQLYAALYNHYELQKSLTSGSDDLEQSSTDESTIGGDTVKVNHSNTEQEEEEGEDDVGETGNSNATVVADRVVDHLPSEGNDKSKGDGDDCSDLSCQIDAEEKNDTESRATVPLVDRDGRFSTRRIVNEIATDRVDKAIRFLQNAIVQSLKLLEGIMQQYGEALTLKGKEDIEQKIEIQREQLNMISEEYRN